MVQTYSHQSNTHVKRLLLSASVVYTINIRLLATSRIITQYANHLLLYNFTTSPFKIDELSSTFKLCHSWLRTFGNWYALLKVGSLNMRFKWYSASRRKTEALQEGKDAIKSNEYLDWCTLIFLWKNHILAGWLIYIACNKHIFT